MWLFMIYRWPLYVLSLPSDVFRKWIALWHTRYKMLSTCFISNQSFNPDVHYKACTTLLFYIKRGIFYNQYSFLIHFCNRKTYSFISIFLCMSNETSRNIFYPKKCYHIYGFYYCKHASSCGKYCILYYWVLFECNEKYIADYDHMKWTS